MLRERRCRGCITSGWLIMNCVHCACNSWRTSGAKFGELGKMARKAGSSYVPISDGASEPSGKLSESETLKDELEDISSNVERIGFYKDSRMSWCNRRINQSPGPQGAGHRRGALNTKSFIKYITIINTRPSATFHTNFVRRNNKPKILTSVNLPHWSVFVTFDVISYHNSINNVPNWRW